ncbi:GNAT family N-acetyltransferase [Streptomyces canus]|uniref:GNAT family N-acetyltransferase n=1 Tax=Streptomyces canus TaxID=58343 RepID=UPI0033BF167B
MGKKKRTKPGPLAGPTRFTGKQLLDGVPGPGGVRIGFAALGEAGTVTALLKAAVDDLETGHLEALGVGQCGTWLVDALDGADLGERLVRAAAAGEFQRAAGELSLPLVARDGEGRVVGALLGVPSGTVVSGLARSPGSRQAVLLSMLTYAKIKAVAVSEDARRRGIGAAVLARCVQVYWQLDYTLLFGEFDTERDLGP